MSSTFQILLNQKPISREYTDHDIAIKACKRLLAKNKKDYQVVEKTVVFDLAQFNSHHQAQDLAEVLKTKLITVVSKNSLNPKILPLLNKISKLKDPVRVENILTKFKPRNSKKSKNSLISTLEKKNLQIIKELIRNAKEGDCDLYLLTDVAAYLKIAQAIHQKKEDQAFDLVHSLDTGARDSLPDRVWNYFDYDESEYAY